MSTRLKPLVLLILDGFGVSHKQENNAISLANTPHWDKLQQDYPNTTLHCSGKVVGLPNKQMGNSEVGHLHIGAGRLLNQDLSRLNESLIDRSFFDNTVLCEAVDQAKAKDKALHIMGLLSIGGIHSHLEHIFAMLELAAERGLTKIYLHAFLDGRDVPPRSAEEFIEATERKFADLGVGQIASITGRFYAMDRDNNWDRVQKIYDLLMCGQAEHQAKTALEGLQAAYQRDENDEFVAATAIGEQAVIIDPEDSVIFMNYRADRAREISQALTNPDLETAGVLKREALVTGCFATLTEYHQDFSFPVAFGAIEVPNNIGEVLSKQGMTQLRLAETEKYAHVTFFLNGGLDEPFEGEDRILIKSPDVKTYDLQPEMNAPKVTKELVAAITGGKYDVIICNYANCDMVGHTGILPAAIEAVEAVDMALGEIIQAVKDSGAELLLTADHGNIEQMVNETTGGAFTAHTTNEVPFVYVGSKGLLRDNGNLADIAPTMLDILQVPLPKEMTGVSLLQRNK